jgi:Na+/H+-dicarboxylate symporter
MHKFKVPIILISILLLTFLFGRYLPLEVKSFFYALSLSMKEVLILLLPFIIFSLIFSCLIMLDKGAFIFILLLVTCVFISNSLAIFISYNVATFSLSTFDIAVARPEQLLQLSPLWTFKLPKLIPNEFALIAGFTVGILSILFPYPIVQKIAKTMNQSSMYFLRKIFLPLLPIFVLGFVLKLEQDQMLPLIFTTYIPVLLLVVGTQILYLVLLYWIAAQFSFEDTWRYLKNIFPATITGFTTMASTATMPVTILCSEKNIKDPRFVEIVIPATVNIHTIGSALAVPILVLATMMTFNIPMPSAKVFMLFAVFYALGKFGVAGVPGGVILMVSPLLEKYLGFSGEMIGLITAVYVLFDTFGTAANVTGNGVFVILFARVYNKVIKRVMGNVPSFAVE